MVTTTQSVKRNHRPKGWENATFWVDSKLVYHKVDDPNDNPESESPPAWVFERRGIPIEPPEVEPGKEKTSQDQGELPEYDSHDTGNAQRMARMFGDKIRFVYELNTFIIFNGKYWELDKGGDKILALTKKVAQSYLVDASKTINKGQMDALIKHAKQSLSLTRREAMIELFKAELEITVSIEAFDVDLYFLNLKNGTVDLRTGELKPHDKADMITRFINIEYLNIAYSEQWFKFLTDIFKDNVDLVEYVQRAIGMSTTGDISNMAIFLPYGLGWNGKSTLLNTVCEILGDYASHVDPAVFMINEKMGGPNEGIANLYKKRFVCATETKEGQKLSTDLLKRATGGEKLSHNKKYQHEFMFSPMFHLWLSGNHRSTVTDSTDSIWLRIKQIPFTASFRPDQPGFNANLRQELLTPENKQGILTWIVDGAVKWWKSGKVLNDPPQIKNATTEYRQDQDIIFDFLSDCCELTPGAETLAAELWTAYKAHCEKNDKYQLSKQKFYERLREKNLVDRRGAGNKLLFEGVKLATKS